MTSTWANVSVSLGNRGFGPQSNDSIALGLCQGNMVGVHGRIKLPVHGQNTGRVRGESDPMIVFENMPPVT